MPRRNRNHGTTKVERVAMSGTPARGGALADRMPPDADNLRNTFADFFIHSRIIFWLGNEAGGPHKEDTHPTIRPSVVVIFFGCSAGYSGCSASVQCFRAATHRGSRDDARPGFALSHSGVCDHTVDYDLSSKVNLPPCNRLYVLMWCKLGHTALKFGGSDTFELHRVT